MTDFRKILTVALFWAAILVVVILIGLSRRIDYLEERVAAQETIHQYVPRVRDLGLQVYGTDSTVTDSVWKRLYDSTPDVGTWKDAEVMK